MKMGHVTSYRLIKFDFHKQTSTDRYSLLSVTLIVVFDGHGTLINDAAVVKLYNTVSGCHRVLYFTESANIKLACKRIIY